MLRRIRISLLFDVEDSLIEVPLVRALLNIEKLHVLLEVLPITHVPSAVRCEFRDLLDLTDRLPVHLSIRLSLRLMLVLIPHSLDEKG
jgi:hypothetical protein